MVDHLAHVIRPNSQNSLLELAAVDYAELNLACIDLEDEIKSGRRKWERRNLMTGECEILSSADCEGRQIFLICVEGVWVARVYRREGPRWGAVAGPWDDECVYFVSANRVTPAAPVRRKSRVGARLLSQDQKDRGTAFLMEKLNDPKEKTPR
jgi:hypothetical protein